MPDSVVSLRQWLTQLAARFDDAELSFGHGTDNAWDEAVALTLGALNWADDAQLLDRQISPRQLSELQALALRRINERIPVPLLLGRAQFAGLEFLTAPNVMIPRSPIAELVRNSFAPWLSHAPQRVLDVCCGGGCIGISIADQFDQAEVLLTDIDQRAVELAQKNVALHNQADRTRVVQSDMYKAVGTQRFDLIVSNPPYVPSAESAARPAEFQHEPELAYDGGPNGLNFVRRLIEGAGVLLGDEGLLVIEVGQWREQVEREWPQTPFVWPAFENGGEGVLLLEAAVVAEHTAQQL